MTQSFATVDKAHAIKSEQLTRELQRLYPELAPSKQPERFSMVRMLNDMALREFHEGSSYEANLCAAAARAQGGDHDPQRVMVPWSAFVQRDLVTTSATAAGNLVGTKTVSALDVLRPFSVVARMGAQVLQNNIQNLLLPNVTSEVTGQWLATETSSITANEPVIGVTSSKPKTAGAMIRASRQFMLQAENAERFIRDQLLEAMGACLDQAVLAGTGASGQPTGIVNVSGVGQSSGYFSRADALGMVKSTSNANANDDNIKFISTPNVRYLLQARDLGTSGYRFVWDNDRVADKPAYANKRCPADTLIAGDWTQCLIALWGGGIEIQVDPYTSFQSGAVQVRALMFVDVNFPKPGAFAKHTSIS
jgi:HK97 family phage major capsid protein